jgi:hypothetical protein
MNPEPEYIDLIQRDLDGELPETERARLSRVLLADPDARAYAKQLREVSEALDRMESLAPPAGLAEAVERAITASVRGTRGGGSAVPMRGHSQALRYAAAFVGGVMLSAIAFHAGRDTPGDVDIRQLVGTMAAHDDSIDGLTRADELRVAVAGVDGAVRLYESGSKLVLVFDLEAQRPVAIVANASGREISLTAAPGTTGVGRVREAIAFDPYGRPEAGVTIRLLDGKTVLFEGMLRGSGGN